jgi:D-alanyl-D-alanine carboxypeptidase (penicillin-binding protein 5/6)
MTRIYPLLLLLLSPAALLLAQTGAPALQSQAAVLLDAETATVLFTKNPDDEIPPASLTKLMTMHIALAEVAAGSATLDEIVPLPPESWAINQPPRSSLMLLAPGQQVTLHELLLGLAIPSGNDAAVAVALRFAPTVEDFVARMNEEAQRLSLAKTSFVEPSGVSEYNMTTASDFASFCQYYIKAHPKALSHYHSVAEFAYPKPHNVAPAYQNRPGTRVANNHNMLLGVVDGVDGLKTGYIDESGYNIALTALRGDTRLIALILGAPASYGGDKIRDDDGVALLEWGFSHYKTLRPVIDPIEPVRIWKGKQKYATLSPGEKLPFTLAIDRGEKLHVEVELPALFIAPFSKDDVAGTLILSDDKGELRRLPLVFTEEVKLGNLWTRLLDSMYLFFTALFPR